MLGERDRDVRAAAAALRARGEPYIIATVVRVQGSSYRRPGARMIVTEHERIAGSVSGGCLEASIVRTAHWRTQTGPVVVTYDSSDPDDPDAVLGCGGIVDVLLERGGPSDPLAMCDDVLARGAVAFLETVFASTDPAITIGTHYLSEDSSGPTLRRIATGGGEIEILVERITPPPSLLVFGTGLDAVPLVQNAQRIGWQISVWNGGGRFGVADRFPDARVLDQDLAVVSAEIARTARVFAIVMSHDVRRDRETLHMLLASSALYIGILGPRHRTLTLIDDTAQLADPRVHAPVGLDVGAETPDEIALSVIAEMLAVLRNATGQHLRTRATIHATPIPQSTPLVSGLGGP